MHICEEGVANQFMCTWVCVCVRWCGVSISTAHIMYASRQKPKWKRCLSEHNTYTHSKFSLVRCIPTPMYIYFHMEDASGDDAFHFPMMMIMYIYLYFCSVSVLCLCIWSLLLYWIVLDWVAGREISGLCLLRYIDWMRAAVEWEIMDMYIWHGAYENGDVCLRWSGGGYPVILELRLWLRHTMNG